MAPRKRINNKELTPIPENELLEGKPKEEINKSESGKNSHNMDVDVKHDAAVKPISGDEIKVNPETETKTSSKGNMQSNRSALILGGGLILMGIILILGRFLNIPFGSYLWPFIFIIPGALVFMSALVSESSSGEGLSILGAILMTLGLVFLFQQITGLWASWAYAWSLIALTSVGMAQIIYGTRKSRDLIVQSGRKLVNIGLYIFLVGFVFFELVLGIDKLGGESFNLLRLPIGLVIIGAIILLRALIKSK
jgi:hypothetical protein